jgi:hypothetical protein
MPWRGFDVAALGRHWRMSPEKLDVLDKEGRIYWPKAVDWDFKEDTFHNQWQSYRTRKNPKLDLSAKHEYSSGGEYTVVVKVIEILGNDTTKLLTVDIK